MRQGRHLVIDAYVPDETLLKDTAVVRTLLASCVADAGMVVFAPAQVYTINGDEITAFSILNESHISLDTWPQEGYLAFDMHSCSEFDADSIVSLVKAAYPWKKVKVTSFVRGGNLDE